MIDSIILGDNAYFGINHRDQKLASEKASFFSEVHAIIQSFEIAKKNDAGGVMLSAHRNVDAIVQGIQKSPDLRNEFHVYAYIPYLMNYVQEVTRNGIFKTLTRLMSENGSSLLSGGLSLAKKDYHGMVRALIDLEMARYRGASLRAIFLHNGIVDLLLGLKMDGLFNFFDEYVRERYQVAPGYGTLNLVGLVQRLKKCGIKNPVITASFNAMGFGMNPSKKLCEEVVLNNEDFTLLAMNTLAQGALAPEEAFAYLGRFKKIRHVVIGASSPQHIVESFSAAKKHMGLS